MTESIKGCTPFFLNAEPQRTGISSILQVKRRMAAFAKQLPEALELISRALRAGHPVSSAIELLTQEMNDPIGSEFGIVVDEITYGADLETKKSLYLDPTFRQSLKDTFASPMAGPFANCWHAYASGGRVVPRSDLPSPMPATDSW